MLVSTLSSFVLLASSAAALPLNPVNANSVESSSGPDSSKVHSSFSPSSKRSSASPDSSVQGPPASFSSLSTRDGSSHGHREGPSLAKGAHSRTNAKLDSRSTYNPDFSKVEESSSNPEGTKFANPQSKRSSKPSSKANKPASESSKNGGNAEIC